MYYTDPLSFDTVIKDFPARKLKDNMLQHGENIIFEDGVITQRYGLDVIGSTSLPLPSDITGISLYKKLRNDEQHLIIFTSKDIYVLNNKTALFELKTRNYSTGTVTTSGTGNRTVTLTGGTWLSSTWTQTNLYEISFDSVYPENCNTWYLVYRVNSGTQLSISDTETVSAVTGSNYCLRLCYMGNTSNEWYSCYPYDPDNNETLILATNGINKIQVWNSEGYFSDFAHYPDICKWIGFWGSAGNEHIFFANVYDVGTGYTFEQRIDISDAGELTSTEADYIELLDTNSPVLGMLPIDTRVVIYKGSSISIGTINPQATTVGFLLVQQDIIKNIGCCSFRTVCNTGLYHIFFSGSNIFKFDGHNCVAIGEGNIQYIIKNINKNKISKSFAFILPEQNLYCLFIPTGNSEHCNLCVVYNYETGSWTYWTFNDANGNLLTPLAKGSYTRTYAPTWRDLLFAPTGNTTSGSNVISNISDMTGLEIGMRVGGSGITDIAYIENMGTNSITISNNATATASAVQLKIGYTALQMSQRWRQLILNENYSRIIFGDPNGYIFEYNIENLDDAGTDIVSTFITKDFDLNKVGYDFRLLEATLMMQLKDNFTPATVDIRASVDFGNHWSGWITVPLDGHETYMEKKVNYNMVGKQVRFEIRMSNPMIFESMSIGFNAQYKSMKFDN